MKNLFYIAGVLGMALTVQTVQAQSVAKPVFKEGDNWEYQYFDAWSNRMTSTFSKQVIGTSGDFVRMSYDVREISKTGDISRPQQSENTVRADLNLTSMSGGEKYDRVNYKWPLEVGKKWVSQFKSDIAPSVANAPPQVITTTMDAEVKGWEKIKTPAGEFNALKIVTKGSWVLSNSASSTGSGSFNVVRWYCPDVKAEVQYTYEAFNADGSPATRTRQVLSSYNFK